MPWRAASAGKQREVVRRVVRDDRDAGIQERPQHVDDLGDDIRRRRAVQRARDPVVTPWMAAAASGISIPGSAIQSRARITDPLASSSPTWAVTIRSAVTSTPVVSRSNTPITRVHDGGPIGRSARGCGSRLGFMPLTVCAASDIAPRAARARGCGPRRLEGCPHRTRTAALLDADSRAAARGRGAGRHDGVLGLRPGRCRDHDHRGARLSR